MEEGANPFRGNASKDAAYPIKVIDVGSRNGKHSQF
jgi:hypothetical protein